MKFKLIIGLVIIIFVSVAIFKGCNRINIWIAENNMKLEKEIEYKVSRWKIMAFQIENNKKNKLSIDYQFLDNDGNMISTEPKGTSLKGSQLFIDFAVIEIENTGENFVFPMVIHTDKIRIADGHSLVEDYNDKGIPLIYNYEEISSKDRNKIKYLFKLVSENSKNREDLADPKEIPGVSSIYFRSISDLAGTGWQLKVGATYFVEVNYESGDMRIIQED